MQGWFCTANHTGDFSMFAPLAQLSCRQIFQEVVDLSDRVGDQFQSEGPEAVQVGRVME
jgi:hypothetical protein